jgi:anti-anti-sigma factor
MKGMDGLSRIVTVMLPDRLDSVTAASVESTILDTLRPGARVVVDGSAVGYMSAAGVRALATALLRAEERDARIVFCRFTGPAAECLLVSGFSQLLDITGSLEEATARLTPKLAIDPADRRQGRLRPRGTTG